MDPVTLTALTLAATATTAGVSAYSARQQNKALEAGMDAQTLAAAEQQRQLGRQTSQEQQERVDEANQLAARIRVARGEAGVGLGGSTAALIRQVDFDTAENINVLDLNYLANIRRVRSGARANITQLQNQTRNPLLDAFTGGLQGRNMGLQLGQGISQLRRGPTT